MTTHDSPHCSVPASPELEEKIRASQRKLAVGEELPEAPGDGLLDRESLRLILQRPAATRPHTFGAPRSAAAVTGVR